MNLPAIIAAKRSDTEGHLCATCPHCGYFGRLEDFDCLGLDDGELFCNRCFQPFDSNITEHKPGGMLF